MSELTKPKVKINDLAEGADNTFAQDEPFNPFKTSTMSRLIVAPNAPTADTGTNPIVNSRAEGEGSDDTQDGSVTSGERVVKATLHQ
jgi:hypothetical protein